MEDRRRRRTRSERRQVARAVWPSLIVLAEMKRIASSPTTSSFVVACLVAVLLIVVQGAAQRIFLPDTAWSFIVSSSHVEEIFASPPAGRWVQAGDWQQLWHLEGKRDLGTISEEFGTIAQGMTKHDYHPPLYNWALHLLLRLGLRPSHLTGAYLNALLAVLTGIAIRSVCIELACSPSVAGAAAAAWMVSTPTLNTALHARSYMMVAFLSSAILWSALAYGKRPSWTTGTVVYLVVLASLLTHFTLGIPLGLTFSAIAFHLWCEGRKQATAKLGMLLLLSGLSFVALHPNFMDSIALQAARRQGPTLEGIAVYTVQRVQYSARVFLFLTAIAVLVVGTDPFPEIFRKRSRPSLRMIPGLVGLSTAAAYLLFFFLKVIPAQAIRPRYLQLFLPLLVTAAALALDRRRAGRTRWGRAALSAGVLVLAGLGTRRVLWAIVAKDRPPLSAVPASVPLLITTISPIRLPVMLADAPSDRPVFAAKLDALQGQAAPILEGRGNVVLMGLKRQGMTRVESFLDEARGGGISVRAIDMPLIRGLPQLFAFLLIENSGASTAGPRDAPTAPSIDANDGSPSGAQRL